MPAQVEPRSLLTQMFDAAVAAPLPTAALGKHLPTPPKGRTVVVGAGKAASQMALALETLWVGDLSGVVVAQHGPIAACARIRVLQAAHPVPDASGLAASEALLEQVQNLSEDDLVIALISGGGSALLPAPAGSLTLADEMAVGRSLLMSGAPISVMNTVRRHISRIKGGKLADAAFPARVVTLVISDVPGDDPALVASGPTIRDASTPVDALRIIEQYRLGVPAQVIDHLKASADGWDAPARMLSEHHVIASSRLSLDAAAAVARTAGCEAVILSDAIEGEASEIAKMHAALALEILTRNSPFSKPVILLSGGETTVTLPANSAGRGGRNSEFLLSFALEIEGRTGIHALAADTDGRDGSEDNAGVFADGDSAASMRQSGCDPRSALNAHDAYGAFQLIDGLLVTGLTGTNVNDFRAIMIV